MRTKANAKYVPGGLPAAVLASLFFLVSLNAQSSRPAKPRAPLSPSSVGQASASSASPRFKGIWEPVSYPEDVKLFDVFFATADEGWVAGGSSEIRGGFILHTSDGGVHWENQFGDSQSTDGAIGHIRFLDSTHGWAMQWTGQAARLLHTRDGKNWILSGTIAEHARDYMFTSDTNGVAIDGGRLLQTRDGGRRWTQVNQCEVNVQAEGLAHRANCTWIRVQFLTPSVAYATGFSVVGSGGGPPLRFVVLGKTGDGGATWTLTPSEVTNDAQDAFFIDENTGYVRVGPGDTGQLFKTTDGGQTWTGVAASPGERLQFADPEVAWSVRYNKVSFTTDGGNHWNSREYPFPAHVETFSLPRRDRGYIVGDHGMIYRYRIVPLDYAAKGMIPAPLLSGIDSPLDVYMEKLVAHVNRMSAEVGLPPVNTEMGVAADSQSGVAGSAFAQATDPSSSGGGFTQNTDPNPAATTAGTSAFSQDTGQAQTTLNSVSTEVPKFVSKYRNLNLLLAGLQMASQMPAQVQALQQSFQALKTIKDPQSATAAMTSVQTGVSGLLQMVRNAFQEPH